MERSQHRDGMIGTLHAADANGFAQFEADNGVTFTVHKTEVMPVVTEAAFDDTSAARVAEALAQWEKWPRGCVTLSVFKREGRSHKSFSVKRTPAPGESSKRVAPVVVPPAVLTTGAQLRSFVNRPFA